jgi:hypothetical protein
MKNLFRSLLFTALLTAVAFAGDKDPLFVLFQDKLLYEDFKKWKWLDKISYGDYIPLEEL